LFSVGYRIVSLNPISKNVTIIREGFDAEEVELKLRKEDSATTE
jgi:hypothetical protein